MVDYKSVLVKNNAQDCAATVYLYHRHDPICWISLSSKILKTGESHLHRSEDEFKFQIITIYKKKKKTVVGVRKWTHDTHFAIYDCASVTESKLEDHVLDKTVCIRKLNVEKEASLDEGRNLYEILKLNFKEIRKLNKDKQDEAIKKAFYKEIRRWHSDIAGELGDDEMAKEVIAAYDILRDPELRADYHNMANYSKGWLSRARWKSIFWSECVSKEQKLKYRKRMAMFAFSVFVGIGGLALTISTAGLGAPAAGVCGVLGASFLGGGIQSGIRTTTKKSVEKGCDFTNYLKSMSIGMAAGAVSGGVGVGVSAGIVGIGNVASTAGQFIGVGAGSASVGGAAFSLAADAEKKFVDKVDVTWKQFVGHALVGAAIGGVTGTAVGAVSGAVAGLSSEVTSANIQGKVLPGLKKYGASLGKSLSKGVTNTGTESILESCASFVEERLDDDLENKPISEHVIKSGTHLVSKVLTDVARGVASTTLEHANNERKVNRQVRKAESTHLNSFDSDTDSYSFYTNATLDNSEGSSDSFTYDSSVDLDSFSENSSSIANKTSFDGLDKSENSSMTEQQRRQETRCALARKNRPNWTENTVKATYNPPEHAKQSRRQPTNSIGECNFPVIPVTNARFTFISKGLWQSKMILEYNEKGRKQEPKTTKSGDTIEIPINATDVKISFKVKRFISTWCNVKKWDRFERKWYDEPHIFTYKRPPEERRFTLDGSLYYEGVIHITNERYDDVHDM